MQLGNEQLAGQVALHISLLKCPQVVQPGDVRVHRVKLVQPHRNDVNFLLDYLGTDFANIVIDCHKRMEIALYVPHTPHHLPLLTTMYIIIMI